MLPNLESDLIRVSNNGNDEEMKDENPQFLVYKESNLTVHCFDNLLDEIYDFILDTDNNKHWIARKEIRIGFVLEDINNNKLDKTQQLLSFLNKYNLVALTLELHNVSDTLSCSLSAEFIELFNTILNLIENKRLKRFKFCFNGLQPIHYQLLTENCIKYLSSIALHNKNKKIALRLNVNKCLFNYWEQNSKQLISFTNQIKQTQCASNIFLTFKHLSLSSIYFQQTMSLLQAIQYNTSISLLSLKFYDNEIYEEMRLKNEMDKIDEKLQQNLFNQLISSLKYKSINDKLYNTEHVQMWKEFERNIDCTSIGSIDIAFRLDFENCPIIFPSIYIHQFVDAIKMNQNICTNVLILLCREWRDKSLWCSLQKLVCCYNHYVERLELWGPFQCTDNTDNDNTDNDEEEVISDFFDGISWKEVPLQSFKIDRIRFASNSFFVDKLIGLIKYGGVMMNFISIAFEMLSKKDGYMIIDAFIYRLQRMYESQKAVKEILNNLEYYHLTNDVIELIHNFSKHNHIRLEIFVDFFFIGNDSDDSQDEYDEYDEEINEKLKIEAESSKLGRMEREIYFKKCLSKCFYSIEKDYDENNFYSVFAKYSKMISVGPIIVD